MEQRSSLKSTVRILVGLIVGGVVGALGGLLLAPQSGNRTRELLRAKGDALRGQVAQRSTLARDDVGRMARDLKVEAMRLQQKGRDAVQRRTARTREVASGTMGDVAA